MFPYSLPPSTPFPIHLVIYFHFLFRCNPQGKDDLNALLYIVITLLFYSMGIVIGIITYLKREQAEMEEDKTFELYLSLKREPFNLYKKERVDQMALYLKQMEEARLAREKIEHWNAEQLQQAATSSASSEHDHHAKSQKLSSQGEHCGYATGSAVAAVSMVAQAHANIHGHAHSHPPRIIYGKDGVPIVMPETDIRETIGVEGRNVGGSNTSASALLCSLTLGVVKPLLSPNITNSISKFELTMPNLHNSPTPNISKTDTTTDSSQNQRHSATSQSRVNLCPESKIDVTHFDSPIVEDIFSGITLETEINDDKTPWKHYDDTCQDLQLLNYDLTEEMIQNYDSMYSDKHEGMLDRSQLPPLSSPEMSLMEQTDFLFSASRKPSLLRYQLRMDDGAIKALSKNDTHTIDEEGSLSSLPPQDDFQPLLHNESSSFFPLNLPKTLSNHPTDVIADCSLTSDSTPSSVCYSMQNRDSKIKSKIKPNPLCIHLHTSDDKDNESFVKQPHAIESGPQALGTDICQQQKTANKSTKIPIPSDHSKNARSTDKKRMRSPFYDSWRQRSAKTIDIPDSSKLEHSRDTLFGHRKNNDTRISPRTPSRDERRGALLYAQKSLHHIDPDSPKSKKRSLGHQESADSYSSRGTEISDLADSPLLNRSLNRTSSNIEVGASGSGLRGKERRGPRIVRSQTVDSAKTQHL